MVTGYFFFRAETPNPLANGREEIKLTLGKYDRGKTDGRQRIEGWGGWMVSSTSMDMSLYSALMMDKMGVLSPIHGLATGTDFGMSDWSDNVII